MTAAQRARAGRRRRAGEARTRLALSDRTVRNHLSTILAKLRVADRSQAIVRVREAGLGGGS
jgi:DNA-binding CsgD family transcriptional regulator